CEIAGLNERGRDVDTETNVMPGALPGAALPAGGVHDPERGPRRDGGDVDQWHEVGRRQQAAGRMAPAHQRFRAQELAVAEPHLRLVEQLKLVALDRVAELRFERQARFDLVADRAWKRDVPAAAGR